MKLEDYKDIYERVYKKGDVDIPDLITRCTEFLGAVYDGKIEMPTDNMMEVILSNTLLTLHDDNDPLNELDLVESASVEGIPTLSDGTIVHKYSDKEEYEVEFFDTQGTTIGVYTVKRDEIRKRTI